MGSYIPGYEENSFLDYDNNNYRYEVKAKDLNSFKKAVVEYSHKMRNDPTFKKFYETSVNQTSQKVIPSVNSSYEINKEGDIVFSFSANNPVSFADEYGKSVQELILFVSKTEQKKMNDFLSTPSGQDWAASHQGQQYLNNKNYLNTLYNTQSNTPPQKIVEEVAEKKSQSLKNDEIKDYQGASQEGIITKEEPQSSVKTAEPEKSAKPQEDEVKPNIVLNSGSAEISTQVDEPEPSKPSTEIQRILDLTFGNNKSAKEADEEINSILKNGYNGPDQKGDNRVSLNVAPLNNLGNISISNSEFSNRIGYVLGPATGLLYHYFYKTAGLVFPYTPQISMSHSVEYDTTNITHSNLSIQHYKNTPPPTLSITAEFTADTPENAAYMVATIWFLRACSKADFGENAKNPGLPPPILYLNGWGALINNIPVVINSFNFNLPKDKHYVSVDIGGTKQWVPTQLSITIGLKIQPNIEKYKNQFDLNKYKSGVLGGMVDGFLLNPSNYDVDFDAIIENDDSSNLNNVYKIASPLMHLTSDKVTQSDGINPPETHRETNLTWGSGYKVVKGSGAGWTW